MVYEKIRKSKLKCNMATESVPDTRDEHVRVTLAYAYLFTVLSPYLTGMRQLETSSRIVRDYFATKINDINTTFTLQSH